MAIMRGNSHKEQLERLWDALAWLNTYDPTAVEDMEGEFGFDVHTRTVQEYNPQDKQRSVSGTLI